MTRARFIAALLVIAVLAGVLSGAGDAWPATPQAPETHAGKFPIAR